MQHSHLLSLITCILISVSSAFAHPFNSKQEIDPSLTIQASEKKGSIRFEAEVGYIPLTGELAAREFSHMLKDMIDHNKLPEAPFPSEVRQKITSLEDLHNFIEEYNSEETDKGKSETNEQATGSKIEEGKLEPLNDEQVAYIQSRIRKTSTPVVLEVSIYVADQLAYTAKPVLGRHDYNSIEGLELDIRSSRGDRVSETHWMRGYTAFVVYYLDEIEVIRLNENGAQFAVGPGKDYFIPRSRRK